MVIVVRVVGVCLLVLVSGCLDTASEISIYDYKCSADQLVLAEKEFSVCEKSGYLSSYCWNVAKKTQCSPVTRCDHGDNEGD